MSALKLSASPTPSAAARCSRRWRRRARAQLPRIPALAELVRNEQDLGKQVNAQLGMLNNVLSLPSAERDEKGVQAINASINKLRADGYKAGRKSTGDSRPMLTWSIPKPPSVEQIKATLADGEAMLSFYFGRRGSFVWAVPKDGPVAFARDQGDERRHREQGSQAARGARAAGGDDLGHSAVRSEARATNSIRCC